MTKVSIDIEGNAQSAVSEINRTDAALEKLGGQGKNTGLRLTELKSGLDLAAGAVRAVWGVAEGVAKAIAGVIDPTVALAAQVRELGSFAGISAEESSKLIQVFDDMGIEFTTLRMAAKSMADEGLQPSIASLAELSDEFRAIHDPVARSQFLMEKFGERAGPKLAYLLEQGSDAIYEMAEAAEAAGLVMDAQAVRAAREYEIAVDDLEDSVLGLKVTLGQELLPIVTGTVDEFGNLVTVHRLAFDAVRENAMGLVQARGILASVQNRALDTGAAIDVLTASIEANSAAQRESNRLSRGGASDADLATAAAQRHAGVVHELAAKVHAELVPALEGAAGAAAAVAFNEDLMADAAKRARDAQALAQDSLDARVVGFYNLAAALKDTTAGELAQAQLAELEELFANGALSQAEYKTATEQLGLAFGLFTPQSLELARAAQELARWYAEGRITAEELTTATGNLQAAAADGKVDLDELGVTVDERVAPAFAWARDKAEEFEGALGRLNGLTVDTYVNTHYTNVYSSIGAPTYGTDGYEHGSPVQTGGGGGGQNFAGGGGGGVAVTVNVDARGGNAEEIAQNIAGSLRRALQSGAGLGA